MRWYRLCGSMLGLAVLLGMAGCAPAARVPESPVPVSSSPTRCQIQGDPSAKATPSSASTSTPGTYAVSPEPMRVPEEFLTGLIGLPEDEARSAVEGAGFRYREVARDGVCYPITADLDPNRVNVTIENSTVTQATAG